MKSFIVKKFEIPHDKTSVTISIPEDAEVLTFQSQRAHLCFCILLNPKSPTVERTFTLITNNEHLEGDWHKVDKIDGILLPDDKNLEYIGAALYDYVDHYLFEVVKGTTNEPTTT